jgi:peptide/nickel transport system substrate-binding protein
VLERNPAYWRADRPYLNRVVVRAFLDLATYRTAFVSGQVDEYTAANQDEARELLNVRKDVEHVKNPTLSGTTSFWMNVRGKPWEDARVRRAVLRATNRDEYVQVLSRGAGVHMGLVSPFLKGHALPADELKRLQPFDVAQARQLFSAAGVSEFSFVHPTSSDMPEYVNIFVR